MTVLVNFVLRYRDNRLILTTGVWKSSLDEIVHSWNMASRKWYISFATWHISFGYRLIYVWYLKLNRHYAITWKAISIVTTSATNDGLTVEDTNGLIRSRQLKERQCNGQKKKDKGTINDLQNTSIYPTKQQEWSHVLRRASSPTYTTRFYVRPYIIRDKEVKCIIANTK